MDFTWNRKNRSVFYYSFLDNCIDATFRVFYIYSFYRIKWKKLVQIQSELPWVRQKESDMIFYFSGTGNSKWAAKSLAGLLHEKTADISVLNFESAGNKEYKNYIEEIAQGIKNDEYIGFVFPVYAWGAPEIVTDFAKKLKKSLGNANKFGDTADKPEGKTFTFALATCGEEAGYALKNFSKIIPLKSSYSLVMPNNYVVGSDLEDEETVVSMLIQAQKDISLMTEEIGTK